LKFNILLILNSCLINVHPAVNECKEIKPVNPKGNQSWMFIGRTDAEAKAPIFWPPDVKNWLIGKDPDAGKDWRQEEKGMTEDKMVGWHHRLMDMSLSRLHELVMDRETWCAAVLGVAKSQARLNNWTECPPQLTFSQSVQSVQSLSRVQLFVTPWIAARQASPSITNFWSSLRFMFIKWVMPSSHLILCHPLLLLPPIPPSIRVFSNESTLRMRWPKYWSFSFSIIPSKEILGLISFRMDWLDLLAVQGTLRSLFQHYSSKASILWCSAFFTVQLSTSCLPSRKSSTFFLELKPWLKAWQDI